jgi:hypothetical protein
MKQLTDGQQVHHPDFGEGVIAYTPVKGFKVVKFNESNEDLNDGSYAGWMFYKCPEGFEKNHGIVMDEELQDGG